MLLPRIFPHIPAANEYADHDIELFIPHGIVLPPHAVIVF